MYLRKIKLPQGTYMAIQESYYDSASKQSRTRTVQSLGYLDALKKEYDDPVAYFTDKASEMTKEKKRNRSYIFTIDATAKMAADTNEVKNVG